MACVQLALPLRAAGPSPCESRPASPMLVRGFGMQLHAAVTVDGRDRKRLEHISVCSRCCGPMRVIRAVTTPEEIAAQLRGVRPPPRASPVGQLLLLFPPPPTAP